MAEKGKSEDSAEKGKYLAGKLLLAMPGMGDPRFYKAVIFVCAHDAGGAMGLVINHVLPGIDMNQLLQQMKIAPPDEKVIPAGPSAPVMCGGPVESARGFILHSADFNQPDTVKVSDHFSVSGTVDALKSIASGNRPQNMLFILGYAGWGAGQLDQEIMQNSWLVADADPNLIFGAGTDEKWDRAVRRLGVDPAMLSGAAGRA